MKKATILLILFFTYQFLFSQKAIFVSPSGNDGNTGDVKHPLCSLKSALFLSRKNNIKLIILRGGSYFGVTANLEPIDSGLIIRNYRNEKPVLYGGVKIANLYKDNNFICAELPENKAGWDFRMILVNDSLRDRSRLPEKGFFSHLSVWNTQIKPAVYGGWTRKPTQQELSRLKFDRKDPITWIKDSASAELSVLHQWDESYLGISSIDTVQDFLNFTYPAIQVPGSFGNNKYLVWNTMQGVLHNGQWYWNKKLNKIYYLPLKSENVHNIEFIIPQYRNVFSFSDGSKSITLSGLIVKATGNLLQNESFSAINIDAAITGRCLSHISLQNITLKHIGGNGIKLSGDDINIFDSKISDIGGGGIYFSGRNIVIRNCTIEKVGLIFKGAIGVNVNGVRDSIINCKINNIPYSGICLSGDSSLVEGCVIKNVMTYFQDGGAIYCGIQKNSVVKNNYIVGDNTSSFTVGLYFDEQCANCLAENNIVVNSCMPIHCHLAKSIIFDNNLFLDKFTQKISYQSSSDIAIKNNLFISKSIQFKGPSNRDPQIDTLTVEPMLRKYSNPNGITSFSNNLILITDLTNPTVTTLILPEISQNLLSDNTLKKNNKFNMADLKKLIQDKATQKHIDINELKLNKTRLNEISNMLKY